MPTLSMFFGIVNRINPRAHNPPHFHAQFRDTEGSFDLASGEMTVGDLDKHLFEKSVPLRCD